MVFLQTVGGANGSFGALVLAGAQKNRSKPEGASCLVGRQQLTRSVCASSERPVTISPTVTCCYLQLDDGREAELLGQNRAQTLRLRLEAPKRHLSSALALPSQPGLRGRSFSTFMALRRRVGSVSPHSSEP